MQNVLDIVAFLPKDIITKILTYYLSYGTPLANILRPVIIKRGNNNINSLWFSPKLTYIYNYIHTWFNCASCIPFSVLCDLRLATIEYIDKPSAYIQNRKNIIIGHLNTLTKNTLLQLLDEEK